MIVISRTVNPVRERLVNVILEIIFDKQSRRFDTKTKPFVFFSNGVNPRPEFDLAARPLEDRLAVWRYLINISLTYSYIVFQSKERVKNFLSED